MDAASARRSERLHQMTDELWAVRAELDRYREELEALRRQGHHATAGEFHELSARLRAMARAAEVLNAEARTLLRQQATSFLAQR